MSSPIKVATNGKLTRFASTETLGTIGDISFGDTDISLSFSTAAASGQGRDLTITGCTGGPNSDGGIVSINSGSGGAGDGNAGDVNIDCGTPSGTGISGAITIGTGSAAGITVGNSTNTLIVSCPTRTLTPVEEYIAGETIAKGAPIALANASGIPNAFNADGAGSGVDLVVIGLAFDAATATNSFYVQTSGVMQTPDAAWDSVPDATSIGNYVYLSEGVTPGLLSLSAGAHGIVIGVLTQGGTGIVKVLIRPERGV